MILLYFGANTSLKTTFGQSAFDYSFCFSDLYACQALSVRRRDIETNAWVLKV